jgi:hypothetical protein
MVEMRGPLGADASWSGGIDLTADVVVPAGRTLVIAAGSRIGAVDPPVESALSPRLAFGGRFDPFRQGTVRLVVAGRLIVRGTRSEPARFGGARWGGIVALGRGRISARHALVESDGHALVAVDLARVRFSDCSFAGAGSGAALGGFARAAFRRCRFGGTGDVGVLACDDARALLSRCAFETVKTGAAAEDCADLRLRRCGARGCSRAGLRASGAARARARDCGFEDCEVAASAQGRSELRAEACGAARGRTAWEAIDDARLDVLRSSANGPTTGLWAQDRARAFCVGGRFERGRFGLRASQDSRLEARETRTQGQSNESVLVEDRAFAELRGCVDETGKRPGVLGAATARADGTTLRRAVRDE